MKLYAVSHSPFAARVRLALRVKGLGCQIEPPLGGSPRSAEFLALNPIGKLPVLATDDGLVLAESETIIDYLDDTYPKPALMPEGAAARAQVRNAVRTTELYVVPATMRLFRQMEPATRIDTVVAAELAQLRHGLALVERFVGDATFVAGDKLTKADCIVLPTLILCGIAGQLFDAPGIVAEFGGLARYADRARKQEDVGAIWDETMAALAALMD